MTLIKIWRMTRKMICISVLIVAVSAQFLLSGCERETSVKPVTPESLIGTWKVNGGPDAYKTVEFLEGREFKIDRDGDKSPDILGNYQLVDGQMIFNDRDGVIVPKCHRDGVYIPALQGKKLSFQLVRDECPGRLEAMKHRWRKIS